VLKFYQRLPYKKKSIRLRDKADFYHQSDVSQRQLLFEKYDPAFTFIVIKS
jgi:hypothetical protein